ncbi:hybrid-cluster protein [Haematococcus lacustris]
MSLRAAQISRLAQRLLNRGAASGLGAIAAVDVGTLVPGVSAGSGQDRSWALAINTKEGARRGFSMAAIDPDPASALKPKSKRASVENLAAFVENLNQIRHPRRMVFAVLCYQCEQTANGTGCTVVGQCGKTPEVAGLQDLLMFSLKGLSSLAHYARTTAGIKDAEVDSFVLRACFSTLTNVNFDDARFQGYISQSVRLHKRLADAVKAAGHPLPTLPPSTPWFEDSTGHPLAWNTASAQLLSKGGLADLDMVELMNTAKSTGILKRQEVLGNTVAGLQELIIYGVKGLCAYAAHAEGLGHRDDSVYADVHRYLAFLSSPGGATDPNELLATALAVGATNMTVMKMLSEAHSSTFGALTPTEVSLMPRPGKAILVTGHDMHDLHELLKQTEGKGVDVYTHGEMLPAHGYPGLKKFKHLAGHYGGAWYQQKMDFAGFPGAILVTTNCVIEPMNMYRNNIFTTNETGLANVKHVANTNYDEVIKRALELPGWNSRNMPRQPTVSSSGGRGALSTPAAQVAVRKTHVTTGFGHQAVLGVADQVISALKEGKLRHIFVVGGCDGHEPQRAYYGHLGQQLPKDTMLLTMGCAKFRLNNQEFGNVEGTGLPRLLDMGQCNDSYSALVVATELAKAFNTDVNSLPLSLDISWFEQKAVAVLLSLLHLGIKNIRLGPALPAFLTPEAVNILVDKFALKPADTSNPDQDLKKMMAKQ